MDGLLDTQRAAILEAKIVDAISKGWWVESRGQYYAVIVEGKRVNHILHLLASLLTAGLWLLVWLYLAVFEGERRLLIYVNEQGDVSVTTPGK